jgi:hypothetical protein
LIVQSAMSSSTATTDHDLHDVDEALTRLAESMAAVPGDALDDEQLLDLRFYLGMVPDPRGRRGRRHPLTAVLALACAAMLTGAVSISAMARWVTGAGQSVLAAAGGRRDRRTGDLVPPQ